MSKDTVPTRPQFLFLAAVESRSLSVSQGRSTVDGHYWATQRASELAGWVSQVAAQYEPGAYRWRLTDKGHNAKVAYSAREAARRERNKPRKHSALLVDCIPPTTPSPRPTAPPPAPAASRTLPSPPPVHAPAPRGPRGAVTPDELDRAVGCYRLLNQANSKGPVLLSRLDCGEMRAALLGPSGVVATGEGPDWEEALAGLLFAMRRVGVVA